MKNNKPFQLFANCIPVKGKNRSVICDIQRNNITFIPNDLESILEKYEGKTLKYINKKYYNEFDIIIQEYFEFLEKNEFIFFTNNPEYFPKLSKEWDNPAIVTNAIIDIDKNSKYNLKKVLFELNKLFCLHIELRFFDFIGISDIKKYIEYIDFTKSSIISVHILMPFTDEMTNIKIKKFIKNNKRIMSITIFNAKNDEYIPPISKNRGYIIYSTKNIKNNLYCGIISHNFFVVNTKLYTESLTYNSCLNRKISIDTCGNIKNCPSMPDSFGKIKDTSLKNALNHKDFKRYWYINKDLIHVCKDCEFRYVCTDCRAYIENPDDIYSKPLKCGYNPYTNKWEEWNTNPLKQTTIEYYGMHDLRRINE